MDVVKGAVTMRAVVWVDTAAVGARRASTPFSTNVRAFVTSLAFKPSTIVSNASFATI